MTALRQISLTAPVVFSLLLLLPSAAVGSGVLSFGFRFEAQLFVSCLLLSYCAVAGFTAAELGLAAPVVGRHWAAGVMLTAALMFAITVESGFFPAQRAAPDWVVFAPFYVFISSPLQEVVCRAIPKLIADRSKMSGTAYVLFSAGVFSLMHGAYGDTLLLLNTFFAGVAWGAAYLVMRNIWPLAFSHAVVGLYAFALGVA